jgi:pimeloyl-ACP methyl ester carboxylesterase
MSDQTFPGSPQYLTGGGGVRLAMDGYGPDEGAPVILLHGGGQTRHAWGATARRLGAEGYRVLSLDLRGHGDSGWAADGDYGFSAFRDDVRAVLDLAGPPAVLVGASMGGIAALLAAGEGPREKVRALVLVDITPKVAGPGTERIIAFMNANPDGFADVEEAADAVAGYLPHRPRPRDPAGLMKNLRVRDGRLHWHWDPSFIRRAAGECLDHDERLSQAARQVTAPTLLVRGEESEVVRPDDVEGFLSLIPQAEVADVAGAGHMVAGDRNTVFGDAVVSYLLRVAPPM